MEALDSYPTNTHTNNYVANIFLRHSLRMHRVPLEIRQLSTFTGQAPSLTQVSLTQDPAATLN